MLNNLVGTVKGFWNDDRGAITTVEALGYTVLIGGAVALVGYGITALARGKISDATTGITSIKAMDDPIDADSDYGYSGTPTTDTDTGIVTDVTGN